MAGMMPDGLEDGGLRLWCAITDVYELRPDELALLAEACRTQDLIDQLAEALAESGPIVEGSKGQSRVSTVAVELRQQRVTLGRLLGQIGIPEESGSVPQQSARSRHAQRAASVRWRRERGETA